MKVMPRRDDAPGALGHWHHCRVPTCPASKYYRAMTRPLTDVISAVRRDVDTLGADLVFVDSLGAASGSEPEGSDSAIRTMNALRSLSPASRLVAAHVSKLAADQAKGSVRPYGSVYVRNLARCAVYASVDTDPVPGEDHQLVVTYTHTKANNARGSPPRPCDSSSARTAPSRSAPIRRTWRGRASAGRCSTPSAAAQRRPERSPTSSRPAVSA